MQAAVLLVSALTLVTSVEAVPQSAPPLPLSILPSPPAPPPPPPPATARSVALGVGYCRDASGNNAWNEDCRPNCPQTCLDTVQECGQACEATADCACFAYASAAANLAATGNKQDRDGCKAAGRGRCVLYRGTAVATQSGAGHEYERSYIAHRLDPAPPPPPPPSPPPPSSSPLPLSPPSAPPSLLSPAEKNFRKLLLNSPTAATGC